jgi:putative SOS response-associated peptidase YedK
MPANSFMESIHDRMPAILSASNEANWLNPAENNVSNLLALLRQPADKPLASYPVSRLVNSPRTDAAECIVERPNAAAATA